MVPGVFRAAVGASGAARYQRLLARLHGADAGNGRATTDVALVTPLRDGLNLVAKEFVASRTEAPNLI